MKKTSFLNKYLCFFIILVVSIIIYIIFLNVISLIYPNNIIFIYSCIFILCYSILFSFAVYFYSKDLFLTLSLSGNIGLLLFIFATFGPVFIDRSISYHIAFIASEEGEISLTQLEKAWSKDIIQKRLFEGCQSGMLQYDRNDIYLPTTKSKIYTKIMLFIGKITQSIQNYQFLKNLYDTGMNDDRYSQLDQHAVKIDN